MITAIPQLQDYLHQSARTFPEKVALVRGAARYTYADLERWSNAIANRLVQNGVDRGDRVVIFADNCMEAVVSFWGVLKANAVATVVNPLTKRDKLEYLLSDCRPSAFISDVQLQKVWSAPVLACKSLKTILVAGSVSEEFLKSFSGGARFQDALAANSAAPPPRRNLDIDLAAIVYTSGSTGEPKGVMLTHRNMLTAATSIATYLEIKQDDVILAALPLAFDYGLYQMIMATREGACIVLERSFSFIADILKAVERERVTGFPGVPTVFSLLAETKNLKDYDLSSIRFVTNTAAALPVKHISMLKEMFPTARIFSMYGLTECKRCTYLPPKDVERKPTSVGIAIPNTELWIVDADGNRVGPNTVGQLVIRGATVMKGYWEKPEATAKKLKAGPLPGEQVLYTGDYCRLDDEGYLYFVGRMDDVIKSRGEKVPPAEVEAVLYGIPGVKEAAVIGVSDEVLGQAVKAFIVLEKDAALTAVEVQRVCQEKLENFMVPKHVVFVPELEKTNTGKIKKTNLS